MPATLRPTVRKDAAGVWVMTPPSGPATLHTSLEDAQRAAVRVATLPALAAETGQGVSWTCPTCGDSADTRDAEAALVRGIAHMIEHHLDQYAPAVVTGWETVAHV